MSTLGPITATTAKTKALGAIWTFPAILLSAFMIGWGAEAAQYFISQGLALAILALLQTLPEFAVEASLAWHQDVHLMLANLTGSLRLLVGLGWPMIYFVRAGFIKRKNWKERFSPIELEREHSIEIFSLFVSLLYFTFIYWKGSLGFIDAVILFLIYLAYLWIVQKLPPEEMEGVSDMPYVSRKVVSLPPLLRKLAILGLFLGGGAILFFCVEPFLASLLGLSTLMGISQFVFIQWVSPFLSEFPEKLTAFSWARREGKATMALMNIVNSNINQWTLLVSMMLFIFFYSKGELTGFSFDPHQQTELALTLAQAFFSFLILLDMRFRWFEAALLFILWFLQFAFSGLREEMVWVYLFLSAIYLIMSFFGKRRLDGIKFFFVFMKGSFSKKK